MKGLLGRLLGHLEDKVPRSCGGGHGDARKGMARARQPILNTRRGTSQSRDQHRRRERQGKETA